MEKLQKPIRRSKLRLRLGRAYYTGLRRLYWLKMRPAFAQTRSREALPFSYCSHQTPLLRKLKNTEMWLQYNKIVNLKIAVQSLNGVLLCPGQVFSYWKLIGKPGKAKGYVDGMVLDNGRVGVGLGGGLCQLSNLIFWLSLHTPLTVVERHRHDYDVFPDVDRVQPFGSGATCFYPHGDLMIKNDTPDTYQLLVSVGETHLQGEWRVSAPPLYRYEIVEKNHRMQAEYWGGYSRHNELYQRKFALDGQLLAEDLVVRNAALMMYAPFLPAQPPDSGSA